MMFQIMALAMLVLQVPVRTTSGVAECTTCSVNITHLARLGTPKDPVQPGDLSTVAEDRYGNFFVSSIDIRRPIVEYDKTGRYLRTFGTMGPGPGQFNWPGGVKIWNDTVVVPDVTGRINYFELGGKYLSSSDFPMGTEGLVRIRGQFIVYGGYYPGTHSNFPLHLIGKSRIPVRSFGSDGKPISRDDHFSKYRIIAPSGDSAVWVAYVNRYDIELWSISGQHLLTLSRTASWYPRWREERWAPEYFKPNPRMRCIRDDGRGNLWTVVHVARPDWKAKGPLPKHNTEVLHDPDLGKYFDTMVEVIRIADGKLLVSQRIADYLDCYLSDGANLFTTRNTRQAIDSTRRDRDPMAPKGRSRPVNYETIDIWTLSLNRK